ncbi:uncharacterized protein LOC144493107 [Mustelus asterias]
MAAVELEATEEWIREKAQLSNHRLDELEFLSLQGTYSDKIVSLGDAFLNFKRLKTLDLSRNSIVSLGGLEGLHLLEKLNLYYNNVPSSKELSSLHHLNNLKELDLRLNPVTRNEENYRLYVIHLLPNLKKLDDRPVRESERKAAQIQFSSKEQKEASDLNKDESNFRNHVKKNFPYENSEQDSVRSSMKYKWDAASDFKAGYISVVAERTDLKDRWATHDFQLMNERQESLCSRPPLSALYSARDMKEARENDPPSKRSIDTMEVEQSRSGQYHSYLDEDLKTNSTYGIRKNIHVDDAASSQRSKMTSSGLLPRHGTSSSDHLLDRQSLISPASSFTSLYSNSSKRGFTEPINTEFTANKNSERRSQLTTTNVENFESKLEPKKANSFSSLSNMQPSYDRKQTSLDKLFEVEECGDYRPRTPTGLSSSVSSSISSLLLNLLDLVDQYWNAPAHEMLSNLVNSVSMPKVQSLEKKVKALTEENKSLLTRTGFGLDTAELQRVKHQLTQKQDDLESLKGRLAKVLDENNKLRSQLTSLELANCAGSQLQNKDLQKDNERLNLEVEYLNQQIKQYNKLQETVTMLQESHRSLVSTNNYLQQQLNVSSCASQNNDTSYHLGSQRTKAWNKLLSSGITELPLSSKRSHHSNSDIL